MQVKTQIIKIMSEKKTAIKVKITASINLKDKLKFRRTLLHYTAESSVDITLKCSKSHDEIEISRTIEDYSNMREIPMAFDDILSFVTTMLRAEESFAPKEITA